MTTPAEVRTTIADALGDISGLNVYKYPADSIQAPAAVITGLSHEIADFDLHRNAAVTITVLVSHQHESQMELLDDLVDVSNADSIPAKLRALVDGVDVGVNPRSVGDFGFREWGGVIYYGAAVEAEVMF